MPRHDSTFTHSSHFSHSALPFHLMLLHTLHFSSNFCFSNSWPLLWFSVSCKFNPQRVTSWSQSEFLSLQLHVKAARCRHSYTLTAWKTKEACLEFTLFSISCKSDLTSTDWVLPYFSSFWWKLHQNKNCPSSLCVLQRHFPGRDSTGNYVWKAAADRGQRNAAFIFGVCVQVTSGSILQFQEEKDLQINHGTFDPLLERRQLRTSEEKTWLLFCQTNWCICCE